VARAVQSALSAMDTTWPGAIETADRLCAHCASPLPRSASDTYCCEGCRAVAALIHGSGLDRYYALRGGAGTPIALREPSRDRAWLEPIAARVAATDGISRVELDVQGMHCAGCVWLMGALVDRAPGGVDAVANASLGRLVLRVEPSFDLAALVGDIERFGYRVGPPLKQSSGARDELMIRTGVTIGLAANAMMFALAIYLGLREGPLFEMMRTLELVLAIAAVAIGAPVFVRGALEGLRRGVLHLDLPIALGMLLALAGSVWAFAAGADAAYADTVAIFVALMLLGRWLQSRAIARNRDRLLRSEGAGGLSARRIEAGAVHAVRAAEVEVGDTLLVAPGEIAVVDGSLDTPATVSLDWISGESEPRTIEAGASVPAGAINRGSSAFTMRAGTGFDRSPLESLLGRGESDTEARAASRFWDRVSRVYVIAVIAAAALACAAWLAVTGDTARALEVATAILVVTCPCGIGIATPLAYELVTSALRRRGLFVRRERALDRAAEIERVAFDKTGTLTTGRLELASPELLDALRAEDRAALADLVARSAHPKSEAIRRAWAGPLAVREDVSVEELPGRGAHALIDGSHYRLGAPAWAAPAPDRRLRGDVVLARDGEVLLDLVTCEVPRSDAAAELHALAGEGYQLAVLSGDSPRRVAAVVTRLDLDGIPALSDCTPDDKARWIDEHADRPTLFVGDGINDGPAADRAALSGTPAIDRPFLPARTDFFFVTPGLAPIRALLEGGRALRRVARRNLAFAIAYNAVAVSIAAAGLMRPWLAAILMPASSLAVIAATTWSLRESRWARSAAPEPDGEGAPWRS
jgi:Cu2+-exporting ATPase